MKRAENLKEFCNFVMRYVGSGYKYYKVAPIPSKKVAKKHEISLKVEKCYETNLRHGQRQYKRKLGKANYGAVMFLNFIIILHTEGENIDQAGEFKEITQKGLNIKLSEHLELILFKDNRDIWTYRLSNELYKSFRGRVEIAIKNRKGQEYHKVRGLWRGLPYYKGIGQQKRLLNLEIRELFKKYKVRWDLF
jgi:hypothetical protein